MAKRFIDSPGVNLNALAHLATLQEQNRMAADRNKTNILRDVVAPTLKAGGMIAGQVMQGRAAKRRENTETIRGMYDKGYVYQGQTPVEKQIADEPDWGNWVKAEKPKSQKQIFGGRYFDPSTKKVIELRHTQTDDGWATDRIESDLGFIPPDVIQRQRAMAGDLTEAEQKQFAAIQAEIDSIYEKAKDRKKRPTISKAEARTKWMNEPDPTSPGKKRGDRLSPAVKNLVLTTGIVDITPQAPTERTPLPAGWVYDENGNPVRQ